MTPRALAVALLALCAPPANAAAPSVGSVTPRGGQRGAEAVFFLNGGNLADAQEVLFYQPGIVVKKLEVVNPTQVKITAAIAPDCALGEHLIRVRCASGISDARTYWVGPYAVTDEKEPNSEFAQAQKVPFGTTVHGVVNTEDVDYFSVEAKKGQRIAVEVEGMRLGVTFFDPYVAILDSKRFELATSDDVPAVGQDGFCSAVAPADGTYVVMVRESAYGGDGNCTYRLHVGSFPRPLAVVPSGGKPGDEVSVTFLGDAAGPITQKVKLPPTAVPNFRLHCQDAGGVSPSGLSFRLVDLPNVVEVEPNQDHAHATPGPAPCAFHGVIGTPGDVDIFKFPAKKGQVFDVSCYARRAGTQLDPVMWVGVLNGGDLAGVDDSAGPDSYLRVTMPQDGEFIIRIQDHLLKGGPTYAYRIEVAPVAAKLEVTLPKVAQFSQERQVVAVPRGNRMAVLVQATRADFGGDLNVQPGAMPDKVTLATEVMPAAMTTVPMVFEAAADAPLGVKLAPINATPTDPNVKIAGTFNQTAEYTQGANQTIFCAATFGQAAIGVVEPVPFKLSIVQPKAPLVHGGSVNLRVVAERLNGFKGPITLSMLYNPPGVGSNGATIPEGQNEAALFVNANGGAPVKPWKIAVVGSAAHNGGTVYASTQLAELKIAAPYLAFNMERGAVEQGKPTQMFCKVAVSTPFTGKAKATIIGLPAKTASKEIEFDKDAKEIAFPVTVEPTAPAGIHRNIFCQVVVPESGETVLHAVGGTELRIDPPPPPKPNAPPPPPPMPMAAPAPAAPAAPTPPPMKRLTRLEQLRLEQAEREKALAAPKK